MLDEHGELARRVHAGQVELESVSGRWAEELKAILERHVRATGSKKAADILARWNAALAAFQMVIPTEYRRAIEGA